MSKFIDLTGQKFGRLTVTGRAPNKVQSSGQSRTAWYCDCDCGTKNHIITSVGLMHCNTKSCGCLVAETMSKTMKRYNTYDFFDDHIIGHTSQGVDFIIDKDDYEKIKDICWHELTRDKSICGYIGRDHVYLHRYIMDVTNPEEQVDHINHDRHDNRKSNLRIVSNSQNGMNKGVSKKNTSGVVGVRYEKDRNKWSAFLMVNKNSIRLGSFETFEEAVEARKAGEQKYFGEYCYDSSQQIAEQITLN